MKLHGLMTEKFRTAPLERAPQLLVGTAYGHKTLGMPLNGFEQTLPNITADTWNGFLQDWVLPTRLTFCANGVERHEEFIQLVAERTKSLPSPSRLNKERVKALYVGGECRMFYEGPSTTLILGFESVPWNHPDMVVFGVLQTLIGNATGFSMGGPGKGMHCRAIRSSSRPCDLVVFHKHQFVESVNTINTHFTDSGIFALHVTGAREQAGELGRIIVEELKSIRENISAEELQRAKNILKINILLALERQSDRLEEIVKNVPAPLET